MRAVTDPDIDGDGKADERGVEALREDGAQAVIPRARHDLIAATLASARHELRSPLQSVQGFAELLGAGAFGALTSEQLTFVEHIVQGSFELSAAIDACVELAELELLERPLALTLLPLAAAVEGALTLAGESSKTTHSLQLSSASEAHAPLDPEALQRAFRALFAALTTPSRRQIAAELSLQSGDGRLTLTRGASRAAPLFALAELAAHKRSVRGLVWWRLAETLLAQQGARLRIAEQLDRAEVYFTLSSTH